MTKRSKILQAVVGAVRSNPPAVKAPEGYSITPSQAAIARAHLDDNMVLAYINHRSNRHVPIATLENHQGRLVYDLLLDVPSTARPGMVSHSLWMGLTGFPRSVRTVDAAVAYAVAMYRFESALEGQQS